MQFYLKIYQGERERSVAICDVEISGNKIRHKGVNIVVKEEYYGKDLYHADEALYEIKRSNSLNAFGKNICNLLIEHDLVHPNSVVWFDHNDEKVGHVILLR